MFDDLYDFYRAEKDEGYFLGSIVLIKEEGAPQSEVIDGQQRLTTLTILLAVLAFKGIPTDIYIFEEGKPLESVAPNPRLTLREKDNDFFHKFVQKQKIQELHSIDKCLLENEAQQNIQSNSKILLERIEKEFGDNKEDITKFTQFIIQRCFLVAVSTPNEQSAFRIFSVLNSRGLDLQPTDILKASIVGKINESERENYAERWEDMETELGRSGFNDLFTYIRMIYAKVKARKNLREDFEESVLPKKPNDEPKAFITNTLEPFAEALSLIRNTNFKSETNAFEINSYLRWLNRIDNADWIPPTMLLFKENKNDSQYLLSFLKCLERLAAYLHICGKGINFRIERYAKVIECLEKPRNTNNPPIEVELTEDEKKEFLSVLDSDIYLLTARRRNYLILRLDSFISDGAAVYDDGRLTIEHVLPQTINDNSEWATTWPDLSIREEWVHRIANLVPLNKSRNSAASNYDFNKKKSAYFLGKNNASSYVLTTQVLNAEKWTPDNVKHRQEELLSILSNQWDLNFM